MRRWVKLTFITPQSVVEPISNFLIEEGAPGVEEVEVDGQWQRLIAYLPQTGRERKILRSFRQYLRSLQAIHPGLPSIRVETESIPESDWGESWKRFFKPLRMGSRWVIKPPWARVRLKKDDLPIEINPSMAFGTGTHATTQLCLEALEKRMRKGHPSVLDVGTGSGILSIAACRLGAAEVWAIDIDQMAIENARENVSRNQVSEKVRIIRGGIGKIQKKFDLVVANLDFKNLKRMRMPLIRHLKEGGTLILSGVLKREAEGLRQRYIETQLLQWIETERKGEWVCLTFQKR